MEWGIWLAYHNLWPLYSVRTWRMSCTWSLWLSVASWELPLSHLWRHHFAYDVITSSMTSSLRLWGLPLCLGFPQCLSIQQQWWLGLLTNPETTQCISTLPRQEKPIVCQMVYHCATTNLEVTMKSTLHNQGLGWQSCPTNCSACICLGDSIADTISLWTHYEFTMKVCLCWELPL